MLRFSLIFAIAALGLSACRDDHPDASDPTPTPTATPIGAVTPTPTPSASNNTNDNGNGSTTDTGATMTSASEQIGVVSLDSTQVTQSLLTIARANGEIWEFEIPGIPASSISTSLIYDNPGLVFGSTAGEIIFDDGSFSSINSSVRIQ